MQEHFSWAVGAVDDMCEKLSKDIQQGIMEYYDEQTEKRLDPDLVVQGEREELARFQKMGVYDNVRRDEADNDPERKIVKVTWPRINKGTDDKPEVRCRLMAQEMGYG